MITDMDTPLGRNIGNSLEVMESMEVLKGKGPADLTEVCLQLATNMLVLADKAPPPRAAPWPRPSSQTVPPSPSARRCSRRRAAIPACWTTTVSSKSPLPAMSCWPSRTATSSPMTPRRSLRQRPAGCRPPEEGRPAGLCRRHHPAQKARRLRPQGRKPRHLLRRSGEVRCRRRRVPQRPRLRPRKARRSPAGLRPRHKRRCGTVLRDQTKGRAGIFRLCLLCQFCFCTISH